MCTASPAIDEPVPSPLVLQNQNLAGFETFSSQKVLSNFSTFISKVFLTSSIIAWTRNDFLGNMINIVLAEQNQDGQIKLISWHRQKIAHTCGYDSWYLDLRFYHLICKRRWSRIWQSCCKACCSFSSSCAGGQGAFLLLTRGAASVTWLSSFPSPTLIPSFLQV